MKAQGSRKLELDMVAGLFTAACTADRTRVILGKQLGIRVTVEMPREIMSVPMKH